MDWPVIMTACKVASITGASRYLLADHLRRRPGGPNLAPYRRLYHLSLVEEDWIEVRFAGLPDREPWGSVDWEPDRDWEFRTAAQLEPEQLQSRYRQACERSRHVVSTAAGLDQLSVEALRDGRHFSLRWVLLHLIEETARHAGHADFLREAIDGTVGE